MSDKEVKNETEITTKKQSKSKFKFGWPLKSKPNESKQLISHANDISKEKNLANNRLVTGILNENENHQNPNNGWKKNVEQINEISEREGIDVGAKLDIQIQIFEKMISAKFDPQVNITEILEFILEEYKTNLPKNWIPMYLLKDGKRLVLRIRCMK
jgi:hypothetical protein